MPMLEVTTKTPKCVVKLIIVAALPRWSAGRLLTRQSASGEVYRSTIPTWCSPAGLNMESLGPIKLEQFACNHSCARSENGEIGGCLG